MARARFDMSRLALLWRYYQVGILNTLVGYALFAGFVWMGLNPYVAQIVSHLLGMAFNYVTYSRHVFRDAGPAKARFVAAYGFNYLVSATTLFLASQFIRSPYLAGMASIVLASLINYFVLRHVVFTRKSA